MKPDRYAYCLCQPARRRCCRLYESPPCTEMTERLELLERAYLDEEFDTDTYAELLAELLPGYEHGFGRSRCPMEATEYAPKSEEKMELMTKRMERGESLFHPLDVKVRDEIEEEVAS